MSNDIVLQGGRSTFSGQNLTDKRKKINPRSHFYCTERYVNSTVSQCLAIRGERCVGW